MDVGLARLPVSNFLAGMFVSEKIRMFIEIELFIIYVDCDVNELVSMFCLRLKVLNGIIKCKSCMYLFYKSG